MTAIVEGLGAAERERIGRLRKSQRFHWIDASLTETSRNDLGEALGIPGDAIQPLDFGEGAAPSRKFHADGQHVVFAFTCYVESARPAAGPQYRLRPLEVHVLVSGDHLLTLHEVPLSARDAARSCCAGSIASKTPARPTSALELAHSDAERRFLERRLAEFRG